MVWEEPPGWDYVGDGNFQAIFLQNVHDMVLRDRNRPSVIVWATRLNETQSFPTLYAEARRLADTLDGTRPTSGAMTTQSRTLPAGRRICSPTTTTDPPTTAPRAPTSRSRHRCPGSPTSSARLWARSPDRRSTGGSIPRPPCRPRPSFTPRSTSRPAPTRHTRACPAGPVSTTPRSSAVTASGTNSARRGCSTPSGLRPYVSGDVTVSLRGPAAIVGQNPFAFAEFGGVGGVIIRSEARRTGTVHVTARHPTLGAAMVTLTVATATGRYL